VIGEEIVSIVNEVKQIGHHTVELDVSQFSSGVYYYQIRTKEFIKTNKMIYLK